MEIVEEQSHWVLRLGERTEKPLEYELEPILCVLRSDLRDRWLLADNKFQFRDQLGQQLAIRGASG
jgi:hypothetical protein